MMKMELEKITSDVCLLARETGLFLKQAVTELNTRDVESKGIHNYVTWVDKESEQRIVKRLSELLPGSGFIAEESPLLQPGEYTWIVDPLDGTTNFIHGVPLYCISIALMHGTETILGVIHEPNLDETFHTWGHTPTCLNGLPVVVSPTHTVQESLFATGFPYYDYERLDEYLAIFRHLLKNSHGARRLGSAAADLAYTACGRYDGFFEYGLSPWDVAAGALLVKNAGGTVSDFRGGVDYIFGRQIVATNRSIHAEFLSHFHGW